MSTSIPKYPHEYCAADEAAATMQRRFLIGVAAHLVALIGAGMIGLFPANDSRAATGVAVAMFLAFAFHFWLKKARYDDRWFECRAIAENVKSAAWLFAMNASSSAEDRPTAEAALLDEIKIILARLQLGRRDLGGYGDSSDATITDWMRATRASSWELRRDVLVADRVDEQIRWYASKARANARSEDRWGWGTIALELVSVVLAIHQVHALSSISIAPLIATCSAALVAWSHTKRFSDLATTYEVAAGDLRALREKMKHVNSEESFIQLAQNVEHAISREHSLWYERRTKP